MTSVSVINVGNISANATAVETLRKGLVDLHDACEHILSVFQVKVFDSAYNSYFLIFYPPTGQAMFYWHFISFTVCLQLYGICNLQLVPRRLVLSQIMH